MQYWNLWRPEVSLRFLGGKLPSPDARHVNNWSDEPLSRTFFHFYYSFDESEKFRTVIYFNFGLGLTTGKLRRYSRNEIRNNSKHLS